MSADEIVRLLREMLPKKVDYAQLVCAEGVAHGQHFVWEDPEPYIIEQAADLIESLQAQLAKLENRIAAEGFPDLETMISKYKIVMLAANEISIETDEEIEALESRLAESQRREKAAIADMEHIASEIKSCKYLLSDGECVNSLHLGRCTVCTNKYCGDDNEGGCKFEWRGPQEAGEGEAE